MVGCEPDDIVCLYLDAHDDARDETPAPRTITAAGIVGALDVHETAADRVRLLGELTDLLEEGFVAAEERPVDGYDTPRTVYFLTAEGQDRADALRSSLREETVEVTNGTSEEIRLAEVGRYFEEAPLARALARMTDDGRIPVAPRHSAGFVDRTDALATVRDAVEASFRRDSRTVVVEGAGGLGKTTLVREALEQVKATHEDVAVAEARYSRGETDTYGPLVTAFDALPGGERLRARLAAARTMATADDPESVAMQRRALFDEIGDELREASRHRPIVVVLDNLQWTDEASRQLFAHLAATISEWVYPVAFVATVRPFDRLDDHSLSTALDRLRRRGNCREVSLSPLDREDTRELLASVVGPRDLPPGFVDLVHEETGGNPLFVREMALHMLEEGMVEPARGVYPTDSDDVTVPHAVSEQIDRRLTSLDADSRELLQLGAVVGERVPGELLAAASDIATPRRREYEDLMVAAGIWERTDEVHTGPSGTVASTDGGWGFEFVSGVLREAVVDRLPEELVRSYHERVAEAYATVYGDDAEAYAARVAHHHHLAGDPAAAVEQYRRAAERARATYAHEDAADHYETALSVGRETDAIAGTTLASLAADLATTRATVGSYDAAIDAAERGLTLAPEGSRARCRVLGPLVEALISTDEYERAREHATDRRDLAADLDAGSLQAAAHLDLGRIAEARSDYDTANDHYRRALELGREVGDRTVETRSLKNLGTVAGRRGDLDEARDYQERSLAIARDVGDRVLEAKNLGNLGVTAAYRGDYEDARTYHERSLEIKRDIGDRKGEAQSLNNLGLVVDTLGEPETARAYHERSLEIKRDIGDRKGESQSLNNLGKIASRTGDTVAARERFERSLEIKRDIGDRRGAIVVRHNLGRVIRRQGDYEAARRHHERSVERSRELGDRYHEAQSLGFLGGTAERQGDLERASECFERSLEYSREVGNSDGEIRSLRGLGSVALRRGALDDAAEHLEQAREASEATDVPLQAAAVDLARGRLALAREDPERARERGERAREAFASLDATIWIARTHRLLGRAAAETGSLAAAREHWDAALETFEDAAAYPDALDTLRYCVEEHAEREDEDLRTWCRRARELLAEAPSPASDQHRAWVERRCPDGP